MNILIFGGTGFLGEKLVAKIKQKNVVFIYINKTQLKNKKNTKEAKIKKFDYENIKKFVTENKINLIINLASLTSVELCQKYKKKSYKVHVLLPKILSKISNEKSIRIIHISTDHLFKGEKIDLYREISKPNPINYYAKTKYLGENEIKKNKNHLIIRTNFFGFNKKKKIHFQIKLLIN